MTPNPSDLPALVAAYARRSVAAGLNQGASGNVSTRSPGGFLITPSGRDMSALAAADMVPVDMDGAAPEGMKPACLRRDIPAFHYMVAMAGGADIRCARYATFGTQALSDAVLEALRDRRACLMANHGLLAWGGNLADALALAVEVEALSGQYLRCLQAGGPVLLSGTEMDEAIERFRDYGRRS
ncbi:MAG: L-fuculose-phosphate aldolase [bacterium]|nr:MAG: L-fuculose-phosphate aldolase [bacterium]